MDFGDIMIIAIAIVFSIISAVAKKLTKNKTQQAFPAEASNPWDEIDIEQTYNPPSPESIPGQQIYQQENYIETVKKHNTPIDRNDGGAGKTEPLEGSILSDFDLEKAVIYAEILKPKFDEY